MTPDTPREEAPYMPPDCAASSRRKVRTLFSTSALTAVFIAAGCNSSPSASTPSPIAPTITSQPSSVAAFVGDTPTFTVIASGTPAPTYQWAKNGTAITSATSSSYIAPAVALSDDGSMFTVTVTNSAGTITSSAAKLSVSVKPVSIVTQPASTAVTVGATATFSVVAAGTVPISYQWYRGGVAIAGATASNYVTPATQLTDSGAVFTVVVSNSAASVMSSPAQLTVNPVPVAITSQPVGAIQFVGETATFFVAATGTSPTYQWRKNGAVITGATSATYSTPALATTDDQSTFDVLVSNGAGTVTSATATLRVGPFATSYTTQQGAVLSLYAWPGQKVAILTTLSTLSVPVMRKFLSAADGTWNYYAGATGITPPYGISYKFGGNTYATIAEVVSACGAGCTYIGATGMEIIDPPYFSWMTDAIPNGAYDQIIFYEMGRSFWLFPQLNFTSPDNNSCFVTGYAVLMRYRSIAGLGYQGSYNSFATGPTDTTGAARGIANYNTAVSQTTGLIDNYAANSSLNWSNTFLTGTYSGTGGFGCTDLFTSLVQRLALNYGGETFIQDIWKEVLKRPTPNSTQTAIDNFVLASCAAAGKNLTLTFGTTWKWPISTGASQEAQTRWGNPQ